MQSERFVDVRKLAAFNIYFRGAPRVLLETGVVVFAFGGLGVASVFLGGRSLSVVVIGIYLFLLAVDYSPVLAYAVVIARRGDARSELGAELGAEGIRRRYGLQQVLLLLPLFIPVLSVRQEMTKRTGHHAGA